MADRKQNTSNQTGSTNSASGKSKSGNDNSGGGGSRRKSRSRRRSRKRRFRQKKRTQEASKTGAGSTTDGKQPSSQKSTSRSNRRRRNARARRRRQERRRSSTQAQENSIIAEIDKEYTPPESVFVYTHMIRQGQGPYEFRSESLPLPTRRIEDFDIDLSGIVGTLLDSEIPSGMEFEWNWGVEAPDDEESDAAKDLSASEPETDA